MNMKKVLAVLLAVMMAVSAMAITAFAEDVTIALHANKNTVTTDGTLTCTIPVYALYGYMTPEYALELHLPNKITPGWFGDANGNEIKWEIIVNGVSYKLASTYENASANTPEGKVSYNKQIVNFGFLTHSFIDTVNWTTIPQSTAVNDITSIQLVATLSIPGEWSAWAINSGDCCKNTEGYIQVVKNDADYTDVVGSTSYMKDWAPVGAQVGPTTHAAKYAFVSNLFNDAVAGDPQLAVNVFEWDHTLANKAAVLGAESAKVVVDLNKPVTGNLTYTLWAKNAEVWNGAANENDWFSYAPARKAVATVNVDGTAEELVFNVPLDVLYNATYGTWNTAFAISEDITNIYNVLAVVDVTDDQGNVIGYQVLDRVDNEKIANIKDNKLGDLDWFETWDGSAYSKAANYKGQELRFANEALADSITLVLSTADAVVEEVKDPVEPSTDEEEDVTVDVEEPAEEPEEEENPKTGLALAVVPMLVAAAAVVASKRR